MSRLPGYTHQVVASLDQPLLPAAKEGLVCIAPALFPRSEERADQRSVVGVSQQVATSSA